MKQGDTICGQNAVAALFARRPDDVLRLFHVKDMRLTVGPLCQIMAQAHRPYREVPADELATIAATPHHGGVAAVAKRRRIPIFDPVDPPRGKLLLVMDGVGNPHNLGAIARSAAFFGVGALLLHETPAQAMPSDAAYRTAAGGLEWLDLFRTANLAGALRALDPHYRTVAATLAPDARPLSELPRDRPVALVLGHEETGVSEPVLASCRRQVRIAGAGRVQSLNVAQAAAVLLHALSG